MALSDIVNVSITEVSQAVSRPGFGTPLIFDYNSRFTATRTRSYSTLAAMVSDGFLTSDPAYLCAAALKAQNPAVTSWLVGRRLSPPTYTGKLTPTVVNTTTYSVTILTPANLSPGYTATYTSDNTATLAEICTGLTAAITALSVPNLTAATDNTVVTLTGTAGSLFAVTAFDTTLLSFENKTADNATATDLAAIQAENPNWYGLLSTSRGQAEITAIAAWAESNGKLFIAATHDTPVIGSGTTDIASTQKALNHARTALIFVENTLEYGDAAWMGKLFPYDPGSETWKFKTLSGVTVSTSSTLSDTAITNLKGKNCNYYVSYGGRSITAEGKVVSGEFIDVIRFLDWLNSNMTLDVFALLASALKVPYTDAGAAQLENVVRARLQLGELAGGLVPGSSTVTVPTVASQNPTDRANRYFPNITFSAQLAGAIHSLSISGTVSV